MSYTIQISVRVTHLLHPSFQECVDWCKDSVGDIREGWNYNIDFIGAEMILQYMFEHVEDALAFKLRFGV